MDRRGRRIDVKTLRATPERPRSIIGELKQPCDVLLAIRLAFDYTPTEALEVPVAVAREYVGKNGKVSWTQRLATDPRVLRIDSADLLPE